MKYRPTAVGYLRTDVSGVQQRWDEEQMRALARKHGYDFSGITVYDPATGQPPLSLLRRRRTQLDAEAVYVPSADHFEDGIIPEDLVQACDVITVHPEYTYARWSTGDVRDELGGGVRPGPQSA